MENKPHIKTICTHVGEVEDKRFKGAVSPIYLSTSYQFEDVDIKRYPRYFNTPNHISPAVLLDDGTSWVIAHSYHSTWKAQGRQGLLCQVTYNTQGFPVIQYPSNNAVQAPDLPSGGVPWMVPKSDMFTSSTLKPEWSFLGYTPDRTWSLTEREGWLYLQPYGGSNTVIQNDGEHSYSLITRVDFEPESARDEAGLWIMNGPQTHYAKVFSTVNSEEENVLTCSFQSTKYEVKNTIGSTVWLKLIRDEHKITGLYSADGVSWVMIGVLFFAVMSILFTVRYARR